MFSDGDGTITPKDVRDQKFNGFSPKVIIESNRIGDARLRFHLANRRLQASIKDRLYMKERRMY